MRSLEGERNASGPWLSLSACSPPWHEPFLIDRIADLPRGLSQVAEGTWSRNRYSVKYVQLSEDRHLVTWDDGKKVVDLNQVMRISIGLETPTLKKLYSLPGRVDEVAPHHWFSLHTQSRSFDFGATRDSGDENEAVVLWVLTLQQLIASRMGPDEVTGSCLALSNAQYQWQRYDNPNKEWPCMACTFQNASNSPFCGMCQGARPIVTLCPCLTPLLSSLWALSTTLGLRVFSATPQAHLLWFLVQSIESPLPPPFSWVIRALTSNIDEPHLVMAAMLGAPIEDPEHPYVVELRNRAGALVAQLTRNGGVPDFTGFQRPTATFTAPLNSEYEEQLAAAAALLPQPPVDVPRPVPESSWTTSVRGAAQAADETFDAGEIFQSCMAGKVGAVRRFLALGGYADTVYKNDYGWKVGPEYMYTKPTDGMTILNYVCYFADEIEEAAPDIGRLLLEAGASLERDDCQDMWFTPLHNAVANGASRLVDVILTFKPTAIHLTTGDGRQPLHIAALCQDPELRRQTVEVLMRPRRDPKSAVTVRPDLAFTEPFLGNTALHVHAKQGFTETVVSLLEGGAPATKRNDAGRSALEEVAFELSQLERKNDPATWREREQLQQTYMAMEISMAADC